MSEKNELIKEFLNSVYKHPKSLSEAKLKEYKFWNTQPVPKLDEIIMKDGIIDNFDNIDDKQITLPTEYTWRLLNVNDKMELNKLSEFINKNYVSNESGSFSLYYNLDFLNWALNREKIICLCVVVKSTEQIVGCITGLPVNIKINNTELETIECNFLCVHKKLRNKKLTTVLIREISRQFKLLNYKTAIYTSGVYLPKPFVSTKYYHRPLNLNLLIETGFIKPMGDISINDIKRSYKLPDTFKNKNFIELEERYLEETYDLFNQYNRKYNIYPIWTFEEFKLTMYNNKIVTTYILLDDNNRVLDFISYYSLPSKVNNNEKYKFIKTAYLYYYTSINETIYRLLSDILIVAKNRQFDVFNALDVMENRDILRELRFDEGTGTLNYYFYNYRTVDMNPNQVCKLFV